MKRIAVVGTGYVGLTTGVCSAELGNTVVCVDVDATKVAALRRGAVPFFEPGLGEMVTRNVAAGRLTCTSEYADAVPAAEVVFIAVGTPTTPAGRADLRYVRTAAPSAHKRWDGNGNARTAEAVRPLQWARSVTGPQAGTLGSAAPMVHVLPSPLPAPIPALGQRVRLEACLSKVAAETRRAGRARPPRRSPVPTGAGAL
jgi:hypothetical protein